MDQMPEAEVDPEVAEARRIAYNLAKTPGDVRFAPHQLWAGATGADDPLLKGKDLPDEDTKVWSQKASVPRVASMAVTLMIDEHRLGGEPGYSDKADHVYVMTIGPGLTSWRQRRRPPRRK